jgi:hypothetical protein
LQETVDSALAFNEILGDGLSSSAAGAGSNMAADTFTDLLGKLSVRKELQQDDSFHHRRAIRSGRMVQIRGRLIVEPLLK